jgi:hypothetical protein
MRTDIGGESCDYEKYAGFLPEEDDEEEWEDDPAVWGPTDKEIEDAQREDAYYERLHGLDK